MQNIFIGYLLIFLDFNLNINSCTIGLLPDFIGYIFMVKGLRELAGQSDRFVKIKPFAVGMGIYSAFQYALDLFGFSASGAWFSYLLGIVGLAVSLYISYTIIQGVADMEASLRVELNSAKLKSAWLPMAVLQALAYLTIPLPVIALICLIVAVIFSILFLVAFHTSKNLFNAHLGSEYPEGNE